MASSTHLVVGVDYGTTKTAVSFARILGEERQRRIEPLHWPDAAGVIRLGQTTMPSQIAYDRENGTSSIGPGIYRTTDVDVYGWTKLFLDPSVNARNYVDENTDEALQRMMGFEVERLPEGRTPAQVVEDYLRHVYQHIIPQLGVQTGCNDLGTIKMDFWLAVPGGWPQDIRDRMEQIARNVGFGARGHDTLSIMSEPEAAAQVVFDENWMRLEPNDGVFLICDCGGGTVDITTYYVRETNPRLVQEKITAATGGMCGSVAINCRFYELLCKELGNHLRKLPQTAFGIGSPFMEKFQELKYRFRGDERYLMPLPLPIGALDVSDDFYCIIDEVVTLSPQQVTEMFDRVLDKILHLVLSNIEGAHEKFGRPFISKIALVGGFGESPYLQSRLTKWIQEKGANIEILYVASPQLAVSHGAVMNGLQSALPRWRCPQNYGLGVDSPIQLDHTQSVQVLPQLQGTIPLWVLHQGQEYTYTEQVKASIQLNYCLGDTLVYKIDIYACQWDGPPQHVVSNDMCIGHLLCSFNADKLHTFNHRTVEGRTVYRLEASVLITPQMNQTLEFVAWAAGDVIGQRTIGMR